MLKPSRLAPGLLLGPNVRIGSGVEVGAHVVIHSGTTIGDNVLIQDGAIIGKTPRLTTSSTASRELLMAAMIEEDAAVLAGAIVFAGTSVGRGVMIGDQAHIRERTTIGRDSVIGRGSAVDNDVRIGERVRIQTNCYVTAYTRIEDDVFIGPGVVTTNDNTMARHPSDEPLRGPILRRACRVGGGSTLCPDVDIGEEAFVAAGAVVTRSVPPRSVVAGVPARQVGEVHERDLIEHWREPSRP